MIRRRLAVQLFLILLLGSSLPLVGAAALSLKRTEARIEARIEQDHASLAATASTLIGVYLADASLKVEAISRILDQQQRGQGALPDELLAQQLSQLLLPSDEFLGLRFESQGATNVQQVASVVQGVEDQSRQIAQNPRSGSFQGQRLVTEQDSLNVNSPSQATLLSALKPGETKLATQIELFGNGALPLNRRLDEQRVLSAELRLDPISRTLTDLTRGTEREIVLTHETGRVLAASNADLHEDWLETRHAAPEGWSLLVRQSREAAYAPLAAARRQTLIWAAAGVGLAVVLSLVFASWLLRPIRRLTRAAEGLEAGDLSTRVGIQRADEIGRLASAFDAMAEAFESLDRVKSEFVRTVSHELRTPLTAMKCSVENLIDGVGSEETLPRLRRDIDRLIRLVNDLLELARLEAGPSAGGLASGLARAPVELSEVVDASWASLAPLVAAKELRLERAVSAGPTSCDRERVRQVVTNLLDNAIKFSPRGGLVSVEVAPGRLVVTDSGPGVPPEQRDVVFQPFAQGGGVGLSIARKLVELHGGSIALAPAPGDATPGGARFEVALPAEPA